MTSEERKYKIFKIFYHQTASRETLEELKKTIIKDRWFDNERLKAMDAGLIANKMFHIAKGNIQKYNEIEQKYSSLLTYMVTLSKELNLENSLELCILYTYLLWNGYLSKDKKFEFNSKGIQRLEGLYYADIMSGSGVCLNISDMLKDFLLQSNYQSAMMMNHYNKNTQIDYRIDIQKKLGEEEITGYRKILSEVRLARKANHVFNLIEDNDGIYIFDATNLMLHSIINPYMSNLINGNGKYKLFPYSSYMLSCTKCERELLDELLTTCDYNCPYTKEDLIAISEVNIELLCSSFHLLEDFYKEVHTNIEAISNEMEKIKEKTK